jgi:hypothetical protein
LESAALTNEAYFRLCRVSQTQPQIHRTVYFFKLVGDRNNPPGRVVRPPIDQSRRDAGPTNIGSLVLGVAGSVALRSVVAGHLYGVRPLDPIVMSAVILALAAVCLAACVLPARRATRVDPVMVLREQ